MNTAYASLQQPDDNDDDSDEGFVLNHVEIKTKKIDQMKPKQMQRPNDFLARYICGDGVIRKEPQRLIQKTIVEQQEGKVHLKKEGPLGERSVALDQCTVVYTRSLREKLWTGQSYSEYSRNEVNLSSLTAYAPQNYSILKQSTPPSSTPQNYSILKQSSPSSSTPQNYSILKQSSPPSSTDLEFDSRFESGNLGVALRARPNEYILFVQDDTNTRGYNRWFYFSVTNGRPAVTYTFTLANLRKKCPFFTEGLSPLVFSMRRGTWTRPTRNIHFTKSTTNQDYFSLTFDLEFSHAADTNYIAVGLPYSYSKLMVFLRGLKDVHGGRVQLQTIAYSLCNSQVPYVILGGGQKSVKASIVVLARQHPGETNSSYLVESLLTELLSGRPECEWLLDNYVVRVFPMVNVDGVIYGNFRCDLAGTDINRQWRSPSQVLHPQLHAIKAEIESMEVACCLDLHGHSKAYNVFAYCCKRDSQSCRVLPLLFSRQLDCFSFAACTFGVSKDKQATARAVISRAIGHFNVLTIETSFFGAKAPDSTKTLFTPPSFPTIAQGLATSLVSYFKRDQQRADAQEYIAHHLDELLSQKADSLSGSDSDPQGDELPLKAKLGRVLPTFIATLIDKQEWHEQRKPKRSVKGPSKQPIPHRQTVQPTNHPYRPVQIERKYLSINMAQKKELLQDKLRQIERSIDLKPIRRNREPSLTIDSPKKTVRPLKTARKEISSMQLEYKLTDHDDKKNNPKSDYEFQFKLERQEEEELPLLCVLSDKKKQAQLTKMKRAREEEKHQTMDNFTSRFQPTLVIRQRIQHIEKLKVHQQDNNNLLSKIWRENFLKADQHSSPRIFM